MFANNVIRIPANDMWSLLKKPKNECPASSAWSLLKKPKNECPASSANVNIPFDIQEEIIKRVLPVKSLLRFRSVSKQWKSLIDSPEFNTHHTANQAHQHHLLLSYYDTFHRMHRYVSIVDDGTFPKSSSIISPVFKRAGLKLLNSSHGLVCLHNEIDTVVVWNPSTWKYVDIVLPNGRYVFGFGVCPKTNEPKIVKMTCIDHNTTTITAEVFALSSGVWRRISINLSLEYNYFTNKPVVIDGVIHWVGYCVITKRRRIITFDLTREILGEVHVPSKLVNPKQLSISKIDESLVVLNGYNIVDSDLQKPVCDVWMVLKNGSFSKLYTVKVSSDRILGFRKNGQPIVEQDHHSESELHVYEPSSEHISSLGIYGTCFKMSSYTKSLLLLDNSKLHCNTRSL